MEIHTKNEQAINRIVDHINYDKNDSIFWDDLFDLIANKLDEYKNQLEEKQKIIDRLIKPE